ncbi:hypothetical protein [Thalassospira marina]|uniref:Transcriptional regulator n=1 Tax=Thalassospira marina TaxID=2048283 RepID=A0ABM6Q4V1_9PROT|nr:hypothetical protein [Thalassospira marina]AUG51431.1 hypothetical protein CSC3H3_00920 [Thalassospira marina]
MADQRGKKSSGAKGAKNAAPGKKPAGKNARLTTADDAQNPGSDRVPAPKPRARKASATQADHASAHSKTRRTDAVPKENTKENTKEDTRESSKSRSNVVRKDVVKNAKPQSSAPASSLDEEAIKSQGTKAPRRAAGASRAAAETALDATITAGEAAEKVERAAATGSDDAPGKAAGQNRDAGQGATDAAKDTDAQHNPADPDVLADRFLELWRAQVAATAGGSDAASAIGRLYAGLGADTSRLAEGFEAWGRLIGQMATGQAPVQNPFAPPPGLGAMGAGGAGHAGAANSSVGDSGGASATNPFAAGLAGMGMPGAFDPMAMMQKFAAPFVKPAAKTDTAQPTTGSANNTGAQGDDASPPGDGHGQAQAQAQTQTERSGNSADAPAGEGDGIRPETPDGQDNGQIVGSPDDKRAGALAGSGAENKSSRKASGGEEDGDENGREQRELGENTDPSRGAKAAGDASGRRDDELVELARRIAALSETIDALETGIDDGSGKPVSGDEPAQ